MCSRLRVPPVEFDGRGGGTDQVGDKAQARHQCLAVQVFKGRLNGEGVVLGTSIDRLHHKVFS